MITTLIVLLSLFSTVALGLAPCVEFTSVCVPAREWEPGCHCSLIRPGQELRMMDVGDVVRTKILDQTAVDDLNRFFLANESTPAAVDTTVFASIHDQVHTHLMTFPTNLIDKIVRSQDDWLSPEACQRLINCAGHRCEVVNEATDLQGNPPPTRPDRAFRVTRALRYDIKGENRTLLAIASSTSEFVLTKKAERHCHHQLFWKKCHTVMVPRVFDQASRANWMNHISRAMVGMFRMDNANLLV